MKISAIKIFRLPLFAIPIVATLPGILIASEGKLSWRAVLTLLVAEFGYFAGMVSNDYFHRETDRITNPTRPMPSKQISPKQAVITMVSLYTFCTIGGIFLGVSSAILVLILIAISNLYNGLFKKLGILGSIILPIGIGLLSIFGSIAVSGKVPELVYYVAISVILFDFGTHIISTFKELERDRKIGIMTSSLQLGENLALLLADFATIGAFIISTLPFYRGLIGWHYLIWELLSLVVILISRFPLHFDRSEKNGYFALQGAMISSILFFPAMVTEILTFRRSAMIILSLLILTVLSIKKSTTEL